MDGLALAGGDAGEAVVARPGRGVPCDRLLEDDAHAAAHGVFERLFGLVA